MHIHANDINDDCGLCFSPALARPAESIQPALIYIF